MPPRCCARLGTAGGTAPEDAGQVTCAAWEVMTALEGEDYCGWLRNPVPVDAS